MKRVVCILPLLALLSGCIDLPGGSGHRDFRRADNRISNAPNARQCLASLGTTRATFTPLPDRYFGGGCSNVNTVTLASLRSDSTTLGLTNLGPVSCRMATGFAGWARFGVDRAARQILGSPLAKIETMGSYSCRNVAGTARLSAHATADAIDVAAFVLEDGRRISVLNDWSRGDRDAREFLRRVAESACRRFSTVLGPDYDYAHRNHLHVEVGGNAGAYCR